MNGGLLAGLQASPQIADKIHIGLMQSLWESLVSARVARAGDEGTCTATVRAYFECLLHGWQNCVAGGADENQVAQRVDELTAGGLIPCIDALLIPDGRGSTPVPGGRAPLLASTVKCIELLCSRDELNVARPYALKVLVSRLQTCRAVLGGACEEEEEQEALALSSMLCAFKRDGAGSVHVFHMMSLVCKALQPNCWGGDGHSKVGLSQLTVLCDIVAQFGGQVISEGTGAQPKEAAAALLKDTLVPIIVSALGEDVSKEGVEDSVLVEEISKMLRLVFRLAGALLLEQHYIDQGESLWTLLLTSVAGSSDLPRTCARVEALAMLVEHAALARGPAVNVPDLACQLLDKMVLGASVQLLLRQGHSDEPGMLLASKLHALIIAALPQSTTQGKGAFLISDKALTLLIQRLTGVMQIWAGVSPEGASKDEALVQGATVTAAMSSAAMAGLETVERVLVASQVGCLPAACTEFVTPILGALFQLRVHSEDMILGTGDEQMTDRPLYDHGAHMANRIRSRTGLRACTLWDTCARAVLVETSRENGADGLAWVMDRARETSEMVDSAVLVTQAMVIGDQANEIVKIAQACDYDLAAIFGALLLKCAALPQGSSATGGTANMWLVFGLRLMHCLGLDTVVELLEAETSTANPVASIAWLFEEAVLAYAGTNALKPLVGEFSICASAQKRPSVWSHAAVCGIDEEEEEEREDEAILKVKNTGKNAHFLSRDVALAWSQLVAPIILGDVGTRAQKEGVSCVATSLALKCMQRTVQGDLQWPRALAHILSLLAQAGDTKYLQLCSGMLASFGVSDTNKPVFSGSGEALVGKARLAVVLVKAAIEVVSRSEAEVQNATIGDTLLYCRGGLAQEVQLVAVHRQEFPPFFSIRMSDGREKQTEVHRLSSIPWLSAVTERCGTEAGSAALSISLLRDQLGALASQCACHVLDNGNAIRAALGSAQSEDENTRSVASLVLIALRELCRCRQHYLIGSELWLDLLDITCQWFDPSRQSALPSPESSYMLAATAGLVMSGHDVGLNSEATSYCLADSLDAHAGRQLDASIVGYWLSQLAAEPNGGCVRGLCARPAAWAHLSARVHALIVSKVFWGSAAQGLAMQVLLIAQAFAVNIPAGGGMLNAAAASQAVAAANTAESHNSDDEVVEVVEDDDEEELVEVVDDGDEDVGGVVDGASKEEGDALDAQAVWERSKLSSFAHVLGELISIRDMGVAGLAARHVSRVRLLATVAGAAPKEVLHLSLVHLHRKRRQALCEALHSLLPATDVVVQTSAYGLLARFYTLPTLLLHLDALEWESLEPEREVEGDDSPASPSAASSKLNADLLRAIPAPLTKALRTSADAAGQLGAASPSKTALLVAAEEALMSTESLGVLLAWLLVLEFRPRCSMRLQGNISAYLRNHTLMQPLLSIAFAHVVSSDVAAAPGGSLQLALSADLEEPPDLSKLGSEEEAAVAMQDLAGHIVFRSVAAFPSLVRLWYNDLERGTAIRVDKFVGKDSQKSVRYSVVHGESTVELVHGESTVELTCEIFLIFFCSRLHQPSYPCQGSGRDLGRCHEHR